MKKYYLSFDCATKTFAYILIEIKHNQLFIDTSKILHIIKQIEQNIQHTDYESIMSILNKINDKTKDVITIIMGNCIDLIPGVANKDISTVERIKLVSNFTKKEILPLIQNIPTEDISILVEFQMSHNTQSKTVSIALLTIFSEYELCLVNPCLKNKLCFTEQGKYCYFIEKYKNSYDANKKHALYNFKEFERIFDQKINISDKLKGHVADAFMQVLGHIMYPLNIDIKQKRQVKSRNKNHLKMIRNNQNTILMDMH